jgi:hypothetical protein
MVDPEIHIVSSTAMNLDFHEKMHLIFPLSHQFTIEHLIS